MSKIVFIQSDGTEKTVEGVVGENLMSLAVDNEVTGIDGDCGGCCSCATCHVYVDNAWVEKVGSPAADEESLLALNPDRVSNSRLCCQIEVKDELDGLTVRVPEFQF